MFHPLAEPDDKSFQFREKNGHFSKLPRMRRWRLRNGRENKSWQINCYVLVLELKIHFRGMEFLSTESD